MQKMDEDLSTSVEKNYTSYFEDILETYRQDETYKIQVNFKSPDYHLRNEIVNYIKSLCQKYKFSRHTLFLAVHILDVFMDNFQLSTSKDRRFLTSAVITFLAAKSEEIATSLPTLKDVLRVEMVELSDIVDLTLIHSTYKGKNRELLKMIKAEIRKLNDFQITLEFETFKIMNFNLILPTVGSYVEVYEVFLILENDFHCCPFSNFDNFNDMKATAHEIMADYLDCALYEIALANVPPSLLAAAILSCVRITMKIEPIWNATLFQLTGYFYEELTDTVILLMESRIKRLCENDADNSVESGYLSDINNNIVISDTESEGSGEEFHIEKSI